MKDLAYYYQLPDYMLENDLLAEFLCIIGRFESRECGKGFFLKALLELADRQWHTYVVLKHEVKVEIESILTGLWADSDLAVAEDLLSLSGMLGLQGLYVFCCAQKEKGVSPQVEEEIALAMVEFGRSVADPYKSLK